jgi:hypothetical protein
VKIGREWNVSGYIEGSPRGVSVCNVQRKASLVEMRRTPESL